MTDDQGGDYHPPRAVRHVSYPVETDRPHFQKALKFKVIIEKRKGFQRQPEAFPKKLNFCLSTLIHLSSSFLKTFFSKNFAKKRPTIIEKIEN